MTVEWVEFAPGTTLELLLRLEMLPFLRCAVALVLLLLAFGANFEVTYW